MRRVILLASLAGLLMAAAAQAKLAPLSDEAKAKAAETAAKTGWTDKVGAYQLCQAMNRVAAHYHKGNKDAPAAVETPPCTDPGAFVPPAAPTPPLEAAGAHSPATTATAPPSSKATAAEIQGKSKKQ